MKSIFLWLTFVFLLTNNGFSQIQAKKEMQKKATDTVSKSVVAKTVIRQANVVKAYAANNNAKPVVT